MYFNRKNAEQKNWRMIKKGKHFLFGCSLVFAVGASLATQTVHADTAAEATVESGSKAEEAKSGYGGETGTYEAPATVAEIKPEVATTPAVATVAEKLGGETAKEVKALDKTQLESYISEIEAKLANGTYDNKTEESIVVLKADLEAAKATLANATTQDELTKAYNKLVTTVNTKLQAKPVEKKETPAVDTTNGKETVGKKAENTEKKSESNSIENTGTNDPRNGKALDKNSAFRATVNGSLAEGEFANNNNKVKQFTSVHYSIDGDRTVWTIGVVPSTKSDQVTGLVAASDDVIESITVSDRGPKGGALIEEYYVNKNSFDKVPLNHQKALVSRYKAVGGATPDTLAYRVVTRGTHHNLFARFASATVKRTLENNGLNGHTAVLGGQRYSDFPTVGVNISSRLAPQPEVNNTYTQTNDTITVPTVASTDETLTGTGTPGARINIKSEGKTVNDTTIVGSNGQWTFPITIGLNSNVTGGAQLVPGSQISVSQTVNGQESAATPVNVSLGHSEIVPSSKSKQQNNLVKNDRNVTLKVPHDAGAAYFQFTDADGKAQEVGLKRDAVPGKWQVNSSSSALASVTSSEQGSHYSTINLTLNKDMKAGTTAKVISNMQEGSYSSLQGWQSRNVEEAPKEAPKEETPAPATPQPEAPKPSTPAVDAATSGPEIVNDLAGKASTPADVTVKAPAGSTVKLYNKDGVVIGEAVANDQGVATVRPTNSLPEGEITATSTPAGGKESAKSTPITVTKTPLTEGEVRQQYVTDLTLIVSKNLVTVYPGDKIDIDVWADGTPSLEKFDAYQNPTGVAGVFPQGHFFQTSGSEKWRDKKNKYIGTVAETQKAGTVDVGFVASNKKGRQFTDVIRVVVLESAKKYEPVAGTKVDVADPNKVSEDEKNKIIDSVKTANPSLPANATYSVDEKGNLTITYPDGSKDKVAAAYLVNPTTPAAPVVAPTVEIPYSNKATKEVYVYGGEANSFDIKFKDDSGKIASATVRQGGNREFDPVAGEANTINTQYGFKANVINAETPATEKAPAVITYSGTPAATDGLKQETLDAATKGENPEGMALGWRYATATDKDGAFIENKAVGSSNATDPGSFRVMLKAQTQKYDIATPTEKVTVADPANVTEAELAKIKEKVQLEYSQNNDDANLADKKGTAVADKDAKIKSIEKDADGNLVVTYADGSQDKKPLSEFVTKATPVVAPTVEIPYSNKATKEVYVYGGEENSFDIKFKDDSGKIASATVRQGGNREFDPVAGEANTINTQYGFKANVINAETPATEKAPAVITYSGTPAATDGLAKDKLEAATKGENPEGMALGWRYATATDKDGAFIENKAVGSSTATDPGAFRVMLKGQTQKYDIATPTEKVTVADPANVTDADLAKIKEKLQLEYSQNNDDANLADKKGKAVADKDAKIQSVTKDDKGNLVVTYKDGSQDKKPLSEFVTKKPTDADKNTPTAKPQTVNKGTTPKAEDSIGNVKDLPKGTKVAFKDPVDTATPGEKDATVVVTYPDGSKEEVPVKVTVKDPSSAPTDADKNTPTAKPQTVNKGTTPKAEDSIGNVKDLPKGTKVAFKDPVDTATPGEKDATVVVTYPDGSTEEVPVKVTVKDPSSAPTDADKNTPTAKPQTVNKGTTPKAEDSIGNVKDLPKGTKVAFKDPVDTATPGEKDATVVVTYPDGSKEEVPVKVTVKDPSSAPTDADKNTPTAKPQTVDKGTTPKAEDSIGNVKDLPKGTTVAFKDPVDTATPGEKDATVVVTYPDGSTEEVPVKVTVKDPSSAPTDADKNTPTAKPQTVDKGTTPKAEDSIGNVKDLPKGTKVAFKDPVDTATPGEKDATVVVTYPDGSKEEVPVKVTVKDPSSAPTDADKNTPTAKPQTVNKGTTPKAEDSIGNVKDLPKGTKVAFKDPVDTATPGEKDATVVVTYPDGSKEEVPVKVTVKDPSSAPTDADKNTPTAKPQTVNKGTTPKAEDSIGNVKDLPKGTKVAFKDPVDTATPGEKDATVVVTYPDGSKEEVPVKVTVKDPSSAPTDADKNTPTAKPQTVDKGTTPKAEDSIGNVKDLPKGTTVAFKDPVDTATPGEKDATVVVTYPDGSTEEVPVKVTVKDPSSAPTDADKNTPTAKPQTVDKGTTPKAEDSIGNVKDLPKGTKVAFKDPVDTATPGEKDATVVVTYPDGSKEEVPVKVTVKDPSSAPTDADKNTPTAKPQTVNKGTTPKAEDSIGNVKDLPKGTKVAFKDPVDTATPGEKDATVVVTYPDGSKEEVPVKVTVKDPSSAPTDADKNTPTAKPQTVDKGTTPKAEDSIGNVKDLPKGTKVAFKDPVDTATPGEKDATVVVTYPDGSKEEVPVKVTVKDPSSAPTDADKNTPTAKPQTVNKGTTPKAEDSIGNVKDLPKGTKVAFKDPVDTATPGEKDATVVVTYPDGSTEEVPVKVTVKDPSSAPTDADKNTPTAKPQTVDKGTTPKAEDSIGNVKDLPKGTKVAFKDPVDTATPGEKDATVVVTYPDGSKEEVPVKVTVKDPSSAPTDADKNTPTAKPQTVDKGTTPKAEDSIGNVKDLPKGTKVAFKDPVDTATPGEKPATVVVTYPDGSKEEVPVKVTVTDPSSPEDPTTKDTDGDGLTDKEEADKGTDPKKADTDGDGLTDKEEADKGTDPKKADTDGDGFTDKEEVAKGTDPKDPNSKPEDPATPDTKAPAKPEIKTDLTDKAGTKTPVEVSAEPGSKVELFDKDGNKLGEGVADENGKATITPTKELPAGDVTAKATDPAGNVSEPSTPEKATADTKAPAKPEIKTDLTDKAGTKTPVEVSAEPGSKVELFDKDGNKLGEGVADENGKATITPTKELPAGDVTAKATDPAGNVSEPSTPEKATADTKAPAKPEIKTDLTDKAGTKTPVEVTAEPGSKVELFDKDGNKLGEGVADENGKATITPTKELPVGDVTAKATDPAGNVSQPSAPEKATPDTKAPAKPEIKTDLTDKAGTKTPVEVTAEPGSKVELFDKDGNKLGEGVADENGKATITPTKELPAGDVTAKATDPAGNVSEPSVPATATKDTKAPAKPEIKTDLTDKAGTKTPVEVTAEPGSKVELFDKDGNKLGEGVADENGKATITPTKELPAGDVTAKATDPAGNVSEPSVPATATKDTKAPAKPEIKTDLTDKAGTKTPVEVTAEPGSKVELFDKDGNKLGEGVADENGKATITPTKKLPAGDVTAKATDPAGNVSEVSTPAKATEDTKAPAKPEIKTDLTDKAGTKTPVEVTAEPGSKVELFDKDGNKLGEGVADENGKATITPTKELPAGDVTAKATDPAGNVSEPSTPEKATADTKAPAKPEIKTDLTDKAGTKTPVEVTAEPGSKVELFDKDGHKLGEGVADENGKATITPTKELPAGDVTAKATDPAGNVSEPSTPEKATADTKAPAKPEVKTDLTDKAGTKTPVEVTAEPGSKVELFDKDGHKLGEGVADENGKATITPTKELPAGDVTAKATDPAGNVSEPSAPATATKDTKAPAKPAVTPVVDPSNLTEAEKAKVADEVKKSNPTVTDVKVGKDGTTTVTFPDGSTAVIPSGDTVKKSSDNAVKDPAVTPVVDPSNLTEAEKAKVADEVKKSNPTVTDVKVGKDGTTTVTFPDGSTAVIPSGDTVKKSSDNAVKDPAVTPVVDPSNLTEAEKAKVADEVKKSNPTVTDVKVGKDGTTTVTFPDGSTAVIPSGDTVKKSSDNAVKDPAVTPVVDPSNLTEAEKAKVADEVKKSNPTVTDVKVGKDGTTTVTFPDGSTAVIPSGDAVKKSSDNAVKDPAVTPVVDPSNLTEAEKAKVADEVKKSNPTVTDVKVGKDGTTTVTFPDGSTAVIPSGDAVKKSSDNAVKDPAVTPVVDPSNLTEAEKAKVADEVKKSNPTVTDVKVGKDGTTTVTFPDGSTAVIPSGDAVKKSSDNAVKDPAVTPVVDPSNLTEAEKAKVADEVKKSNPTVTDVKVGKDGTTTVTFPDGSTAVIPSGDAVKKSSDNAVKDPAVTPVVDPSNLTEAEKAKVADEVKKSNPTVTDVKVGKDGTTTVTFPDGSTAVIPSGDAVKKSSDNAVKDPAVTPVVDPSNLTEAEKAKVAEAVKKANPTVTDVKVGKDGTTTVTFPDGSTAVIPSGDAVKKSSDNAVKDPAVTPVVDPSNLTEAEKAKVAEAVKKANPTVTDVKVGKDGTTTVTFPDGSTAVIPSGDTVKKSSDNAVKDPAVTPVVDPSNLTEAEKAKVAEAVKKANPTVTDVKVGKDGTVTVTYPDGTTAVIPADKAVKKSNPTATDVKVGKDGTTAVIPANKADDKSKDADGVKDPSVTQVTDPSNLTDAEKAKVAEAVKKSNPTATDVKVGKDGTTTVTFPDGSTAVIPADKAVTSAEQGSHAVAPADKAVTSAEQGSHAATPAKKAGAKELPNTGTADSTVAMVAAAASALLGLGLAGRRRKEDEEA